MSEPSYEEMPYEGHAIPASAPAVLALTARAHGGPCPPLERARVLELGCGDGANLLPLAFHHPDWTLVGVDASARAIAVAEEGARVLRLANVRFVHADVASFTPDGEHDYVIAHGLYSWIDADRRAAVRRIMRTTLAAHGLAYVSFNALPAWGVRGRVRDALARTTSDIESARARTSALLAVLGEPSYEWAALLRRELERAAVATDGYLAHEYLAAHNEAFWLGDVARDFAREGMRYVGDATFDRPEGFVHPELRARVRAMVSDPVAEEELIDLIAYRQLRAAVFARDDAPFAPAAGPELLDEARIASVVRATSDPFDPSPGIEETFVGPRGTEVRISSSLAKIAMLVFARDYPRAYRLSEVCAIAARLLAEQRIAPEPDAKAKLRAGLFDLWRHLEVEVRLDAPELCTQPGVRPVASELARYEAACRPALTTPLHTALPIESIDRAIIRRLDGTRDRGELARALLAAIESGELELEGAPCGAVRIAPLLEQRIEATLTMLGHWGLVR